MYKILIFGTGDGSCRLKRFLDYKKANIVAYVDNNIFMQNTIIEGIKVIAPEHINQYDFDYIIIASGHYKEIELQLTLLGIDNNKVYPFFKYLCSHPHVMEFLSIDKKYEGFVTGISYAKFDIYCSEFKRKIFNFGLPTQDIYSDYMIISYCFENFSEKMKYIKYAIIVLEYYSFDYEQRKTREFDVHYSNQYNFLEGRKIDIFKKDFKYYEKLNIDEQSEYKGEKWFETLNQNKIHEFYTEQMDSFEKQFNKNYVNSIEKNKLIFEKYISMLKDNHVEPIIVICPQNIYIRNIVKNETKTKFYDILNSFISKYNLQILDYFENDSFNEEDYFDISHLNIFGATKLTNLLERDINWNK